MEGTGRLFMSKEAVNGHVVPNTPEACQERRARRLKCQRLPRTTSNSPGTLFRPTSPRITSNGQPGLIADVNSALRNIGQPTPEPVKAEPPVPIKQTIKPDYIISLEDGKRYRSLKRHLSAHGLTPEQYREKWGAPGLPDGRAELFEGSVGAG
jgi:hypothetical protein